MLQVLLLLSISSCSTHLFWQADDAPAAPPARPRSLQLLHLQRREGEVTWGRGPKEGGAVAGSRQPRRVLESFPDDTRRGDALTAKKQGRAAARESERERTKAQDDLPVVGARNTRPASHLPHAVRADGQRSNRTREGSPPRGKQQASEEEGARKRQKTGAMEGGKAVGMMNERRNMQRRQQGASAPGIVVSGEGLEEAVMGELATVFVELQGWASDVCSRNVRIRLMRANGYVESNGTEPKCRSFKEQPPPLLPPRPSAPSTPAPAVSGEQATDTAGNASVPAEPLPPSSDASQTQSPPANSAPPPPPSTPSPPTDEDGEDGEDDEESAATHRRAPGGGARRSGARALRAADDAEGQDVIVAGGSSGNSTKQCSIPDASGACEVYTIDYMASHWGSFLLVVMINGQQAPGSPFRPFVFPPPTYPWFNASSLQVSHRAGCVMWW